MPGSKPFSSGGSRMVLSEQQRDRDLRTGFQGLNRRWRGDGGEVIL